MIGEALFLRKRGHRIDREDVKSYVKIFRCEGCVHVVLELEACLIA